MIYGFFQHLALISLFELKRLFGTGRGLLLLITFAVVWYFILMYPLRFTAEMLLQGQYLEHSSRFFEFLGFGSVINWPIAEMGVLWHVSLIMFPLLCIFIAADQSCSDRERGTLRFLALRTSRDCIYFGRFTGVLLVQAVLVGLVLATTSGLVMYRNSSLLPVTFYSASIIAVNLVLVLLPFNAMMALLSTLVSSSRQATVWAILIWSFLSGIINMFTRNLPDLNVLKLLVPGSQLAQLAQLSGWDTLQLAPVPLLQTVLLLAAGRWVMMRQAL